MRILDQKFARAGLVSLANAIPAFPHRAKKMPIRRVKRFKYRFKFVRLDLPLYNFRLAGFALLRPLIRPSGSRAPLAGECGVRGKA